MILKQLHYHYQLLKQVLIQFLIPLVCKNLYLKRRNRFIFKVDKHRLLFFYPFVAHRNLSALTVVSQLCHVIYLNLVKAMEHVLMIILHFLVISVHVYLVLMVHNVNMVIDLVNPILVGIMVFVMKHQIQHFCVYVHLDGKIFIVKHK